MTAEPSAVHWSAVNTDMTVVSVELSRLWSELVDRQGTGAVRTHISNLVVYARDRAEADRTKQTLERLAERHPSRTIIIVAERGHPGTRVDAAVTADCRAFTPQGAPLCHEEVIVEARGRAADHPASVVTPLLLPELPTYLWWPGQPPFGHRLFHRLLAVTDQLVIDSAEFQSPGDGLANIARIVSGRVGVNDFQWARLTPWREIVAQFFDGNAWLPYLFGVRSVRLEFGSGSDEAGPQTASSLLFLGWIASELGWEPESTLDGLATEDVSLAVTQGDRVIPIEIQFREHGKGSSGEIVAIEIVSQPKGEQPARFVVARQDASDHVMVTTAVYEGADISRVVPLVTKNDVDLLADELELAGRDQLYCRVAEMASRMAGRELWITV
ncbi:MAG: glucose-6-phosphate dehydrogenase assembly protein OpcA [Chloroflexota bacterium]